MTSSYFPARLVLVRSAIGQSLTRIINEVIALPGWTLHSVTGGDTAVFIGEGEGATFAATLLELVGWKHDELADMLAPHFPPGFPADGTISGLGLSKMAGSDLVDIVDRAWARYEAMDEQAPQAMGLRGPDVE